VRAYPRRDVRALRHAAPHAHHPLDPDRARPGATCELGRRHLLARRPGPRRLDPGNPAWGHCDITALVVHDIFGGDLLVGDVHHNGEPAGYHWWNRLPSGTELDLTREQFRDGQTIGAPRLIHRPPGPLPRRGAEYALLRDRVAARLGPLPEVPAPWPDAILPVAARSGSNSA
jgi:hypothetical protein